jgi:hypothetical protein
MSVVELIAEKSKRLSPETQKEILHYVEFLTEKEPQKIPDETITMSFAWAGALAHLNQTALDAQKEILEKRGEM